MKGWEITVSVSRENDKGKPVTLCLDSAPVTIGSLASSDVVLSDPRVSGDHAKVVVSRGALILHDHSRNGTFVGAERVQKRTLKPDDVIVIPPFHLRFALVVHARAAPRTADFSRPDVPVLEVHGVAELEGTRLPLPPEGVRIGRSPEAELCLAVPTLSRFHAEVRPDGNGGWFVKDLKSANGVYVGGQRTSHATLLHATEMSMGSIRLVFLRGAAPTGAIPSPPKANPSPPIEEPAADTARVPPGAAEFASRELPGLLQPRREGARLEMTRAEGNVLVVSVSGRVDGDNYTELGQALDRVTDSRETMVVLDLARLSFIDHTGLGVIVKTVSAVEAYGGQMRLAGVGERLAETFSLSRLDTFFKGKVFADQRTAIARLVRRR